MDSSALGPAAAGLVADPFLWAGAACLAVGLSAGQACRALFSAPWGRGAFLRKRSSRVARAIVFLGLSFLAFAALLILADKPSLSSSLAAGFGGGMSLLPWACAAAAAGFFAGWRPAAFGLPLLGLCLAASLLLGLCLEGWLPFRSSGGEGFEVARLLPYEAGPAGFRGQLELPERDSVPVAQDLALSANAVRLRVESISFSGPLRALAWIATRGAVSAPRAVDQSAPDQAAASPFSPVLRLYRVVGLSSPDGKASLSFARPRHAALLDAFLGLRGGSLASNSSSALFGLASRGGRSSEAAALVALEPVAFVLAADGSEVAARAER